MSTVPQIQNPGDDTWKEYAEILLRTCSLNSHLLLPRLNQRMRQLSAGPFSADSLLIDEQLAD